MPTKILACCLVPVVSQSKEVVFCFDSSLPPFGHVSYLESPGRLVPILQLPGSCFLGPLEASRPVDTAPALCLHSVRRSRSVVLTVSLQGSLQID